MLTSNTRELLDRLRTGQLAVSDVADLEHLSAQSLIRELQAHYPVVFQQRALRQKQETGLARRVSHEFAIQARADRLFPRVQVCARLWGCLLVSSYDDVVSELTVIASIQVLPSRRPVQGLILKMDRGYKLDRTPDGWAVKPLQRCSVKLSEEQLKGRGWRFDVLSPLGRKP